MVGLGCIGRYHDGDTKNDAEVVCDCPPSEVWEFLSDVCDERSHESDQPSELPPEQSACLVFARIPGTWIAYVCDGYCRQRKRISDNVTCPLFSGCVFISILQCAIPKLNRLMAPLPSPRRLRPLPSILPFILRRDGEWRLPYEGMGYQATRPPLSLVESPDRTLFSLYCLLLGE